MVSRNKKVLYLTYDGISDPLGYSQVFAYLKGLSQTHKITLISFEKKENRHEIWKLREEAKRHGIRWFGLRYHKSPTLLATSFDLFQGLFLSLMLSIPGRFDIVHCRSYVVAVIALFLKKFTGAIFLFDMRGFWVDERIEGGLWKKDSLIVKLGRVFERFFFLNADRVISLSHAGAGVIERLDYLQGKCPKIDVITTCTDLSRFQLSESNSNDHRFVVGYVGSVGLWYDFEATARCFKLFLEQERELKPYLYIINQKEHAFIRLELEKAGISPSDYSIVARSFYEMPQEFAKMHAGIFFIRPTLSKQASAATKLGEFLASGVPCLINAGVGDSKEIIESNHVGVVLNGFESVSMLEGIAKLKELCEDPKTRYRCRKTAERLFSLDLGIESYKRVYDELLEAKLKAPLLHVKDASQLPV